MKATVSFYIRDNRIKMNFMIDRYKIYSDRLRKMIFCALMLPLVAGLLPACTKDTAPKSQAQKKIDYGSLPYVVQDNYTFSLYSQALAATGYADTLSKNAGPYTIFVPNNDAFTASKFYYNDGVNYLLNAYDPTTKDYVRYLIIPRKISLAALPVGENQQFPTLEGTPVYISKYVTNQGADTVITVNGAVVLSNGIDLPASNGLIDVISGIPEPQIYPDLWQRMLKDGSLAFFTTAIQRAGLQSFFQAQGQPMTVLAPSNDAFTQMYVGPDSLDLSSIDKIESADPALVKNLVLYHVLKGIRFTNDFAKADTLGYGDSVTLTMYNGETMEYTGQQFYSFKLAPAAQSVLVNGVYVIEYIGPPTPLVATYFSEFVYQTPNVSYTDRPTGNGVLQEICTVMVP